MCTSLGRSCDDKQPLSDVPVCTDWHYFICRLSCFSHFNTFLTINISKYVVFQYLFIQFSIIWIILCIDSQYFSHFNAFPTTVTLYEYIICICGFSLSLLLTNFWQFACGDVRYFWILTHFRLLRVKIWELALDFLFNTFSIVCLILCIDF